MIEQVEELNDKSAEMAYGIDADTILCDLMDESDFEVSGLAQDIFDMWKRKDNSGRKAVEQMFYLFTEVEFDRYLTMCYEQMKSEDMKKYWYYVKCKLCGAIVPEEHLICGIYEGETTDFCPKCGGGYCFEENVCIDHLSKSEIDKIDNAYAHMSGISN
jgi:hypothetical protein